MEEYSSYYSVVMGVPHHSQAPWPSVFQGGGGAVIPCRFEIRNLSTFTKELMLDHLTKQPIDCFNFKFTLLSC